ncbi:Ilp is an apoptosis inhibitor [Pleurostoma richardsiae]|uniref:Ilp is an apoptosis inhibitor n=1 Tax=Pleurostoma richardsiae TaxID=41990 RepID=A0AA38R5X1_9PEZI|nr:Ilp is an apoptosis inhibitor [Pleurostoma richardsiae]
MAFSGHPGGGSSSSFQRAQPFMDPQFDIFEWHGKFRSCVRYFLDHAQYSGPVQAVAAFINIQLPFQRPRQPVLSSKPAGSPAAALGAGGGSIAMPGAPPAQVQTQQPLAYVTLIPYIRRLIATGFDVPAVLHSFFGDDWAAGIGPMHEAERRNYLFAAKSDNWLKVKADYDMDEGQGVPFLVPLQNVSEKEILAAESRWSEWLAMQDWMLGPRAPQEVRESPYGGGVRVKREED